MENKKSKQLVNKEVEPEENLHDLKELSTVSEMVVKEIIEKLISYCITKISAAENELMIPAFCFDYSKKVINNLLEATFFLYEQDDFLTKKKENKLFYNYQYQGSNEWKVTFEPV
jgi:hypothetical protein